MSEGAHRHAAATDGDTTASNAAGNLLTSWPNPTSVLVGALGVGTSAYLAAVYMAANARRKRAPSQEHDLRSRALWAGVVAGERSPSVDVAPRLGWRRLEAKRCAVGRSERQR